MKRRVAALQAQADGPEPGPVHEFSGFTGDSPGMYGIGEVEPEVEAPLEHSHEDLVEMLSGVDQEGIVKKGEVPDTAPGCMHFDLQDNGFRVLLHKHGVETRRGAIGAAVRAPPGGQKRDALEFRVEGIVALEWRKICREAPDSQHVPDSPDDPVQIFFRENKVCTGMFFRMVRAEGHIVPAQAHGDAGIDLPDHAHGPEGTGVPVGHHAGDQDQVGPAKGAGALSEGFIIQSEPFEVSGDLSQCPGFLDHDAWDFSGPVWLIRRVEQGSVQAVYEPDIQTSTPEQRPDGQESEGLDPEVIDREIFNPGMDQEDFLQD